MCVWICVCVCVRYQIVDADRAGSHWQNADNGLKKSHWHINTINTYTLNRIEDTSPVRIKTTHRRLFCNNKTDWVQKTTLRERERKRERLRPLFFYPIFCLLAHLQEVFRWPSSVKTTLLQIVDDIVNVVILVVCVCVRVRLCACLFSIIIYTVFTIIISSCLPYYVFSLLLHPFIHLFIHSYTP